MARGYPDFEGDKSGLYQIPFWAAKEAVDKNFYGVGTSVGLLSSKTVQYTVPTGKTLYITHLSFLAAATDAADRDNNQHCAGLVYDHILASFIWSQGGNGGGSAIFNKPLVFTEGEVVTFYCTNYSNHLCTLTISAGGFEI